MDEVTGAVTATAEIAKALSPLIDNFAKLTGPMCDELGLYFGERVRTFRHQNITNVIEDSIKKLESTGKPVNPVPPRLLIPIFEAASVEDNPTLQDMWSGLLASASDRADNMSPSYVETLKALTPMDAQALTSLYESRPSLMLGSEYELSHRISVSISLPEDSTSAARLKIETFERLGLIRREIELYHAGKNPQPKMGVSPFIFPRPGISPLPPEWLSRNERNWPEPLPEVSWQFVFTSYGIQFMNACEGANETLEEICPPCAH